MPINDVDSLKNMPFVELRRLWRDHVGRNGRKREPPRIRCLLIRDLAWWIQQNGKIGLDAKTQSLLNAAMRLAEDTATQTTDTHGTRNVRKSSKHHPKPELQTGTTLLRTWRGRIYQVKVLENGKRFEFGGEVYRSLTIIARKITGAHWSGPRFFGLNRVRSTG